jgi:hypothetical protein
MRAGKPERLILERPDPRTGVDVAWLPGEALIARVARLESGLGMAFLDAGADAPPLTVAAGDLREGARLQATVTASARGDKLAVARTGDAASQAELGRQHSRPTVTERLLEGAAADSLRTGPDAREAADLAEAEALQSEHALPGGVRLYIEPTRALVAVDIDVGPSSAGGDRKRRQRQANLSAIRELPRLLRLKGLGGLIAIDLVGKGHDGDALAAAAKAAFSEVYPAEAAIGPISRFGILQIQLPWRETPTTDLRLDSRGDPTPVTLALRLLREIEREAGPGGRVEAFCAPPVCKAAQLFADRLRARIGARFRLSPDASLPPQSSIVRPW